MTAISLTAIRSVNLRMGGTTHPMLALRFLTGGELDESSSLLYAADVFHMIGAVSQFGKVGMTAIGDSRAEADRFFQRTVAVLDTRGRSHV